MSRTKDVGHPLGWLPYVDGGGTPHPRWIGKRKTHNHKSYNVPPEPLNNPGPVRSLYALSLLSRSWFGYRGGLTDYQITPDYIAWCMFWSVPIVELARKVVDRTATVEDEDKLRFYLGKIPDHAPLTLDKGVQE